MKIAVLSRYCLLYLSFFCINTRSQELPKEEPQTIEIKQLKTPELKPYRTMLKGAQAYDTYHALAPNAPFRLMLKVRKEGLDINEVTLKLVGTDSNIQIPIAGNGSFELPRRSESEFDDAELVLNQKKIKMLLVGARIFVRPASILTRGA